MEDFSHSIARRAHRRLERGNGADAGDVSAKLEALRRYEEMIRALELRIWPQNRLANHQPDPVLLKLLGSYQEEADRLFVEIAEMTGKPPLEVGRSSD
jgi:hypothetical protein